jgi:putative transposase
MNALQSLSIEDARRKIEVWRGNYSQRRPRGPLGQLTPREFLKRFEKEDKEAARFRL